MRQRLLFMMVAGALVTCIRAALNETPSAMQALAVTGAQLLCLVVVTIVGSWPLNSYRMPVQMGLAGAFGLTVTGLVISAFRSWPSYPWWFWVVGLLTTWVVICGGVVVGLACLATALRRRYWPIYPEGYCQYCGHNLFGPEQHGCPECGTPFEIEESLTGSTTRL